LAKGFHAIAWVESNIVKKKGMPRMPLILSELADYLPNFI
jgi:hypothetical protein